MSRRVWILIALAAAMALAVGAVPAFTADSGTITGTVHAQAPAAPCIELSTTTLDFGTHPFAANGQLSFGVGDRSFTTTNCATADARFLIAGTHARAEGSSQVWTLTDGWEACDGTLNRFGLLWFESETNNPFTSGRLTTTPSVLTHYRPPDYATPQTVFQPGEAEELGAQVNLPCAGSDGVGSALTFGISLITTVA